MCQPSNYLLVTWCQTCALECTHNYYNSPSKTSSLSSATHVKCSALRNFIATAQPTGWCWGWGTSGVAGGCGCGWATCVVVHCWWATGGQVLPTPICHLPRHRTLASIIILGPLPSKKLKVFGGGPLYLPTAAIHIQTVELAVGVFCIRRPGWWWWWEGGRMLRGSTWSTTYKLVVQQLRLCCCFRTCLSLMQRCKQ